MGSRRATGPIGLSATLGGLLWGVGAAAAQGDLISNGSFEEPALQAVGFLQLVGPNASFLRDWTAVWSGEGATPRLVNHFPRAGDFGSQYVVLGPHDSIGTHLPLIGGVQHRVRVATPWARYYDQCPIAIRLGGASATVFPFEVEPSQNGWGLLTALLDPRVTDPSGELVLMSEPIAGGRDGVTLDRISVECLWMDDQPAGGHFCLSSPPTASVVAGGAPIEHRWEARRMIDGAPAWTPLEDGVYLDGDGNPLATVVGASTGTIRFDPPYTQTRWSVNVRCTVRNACGAITSAGVQLVGARTRAAEYNHDGFLDHFDYLDFVSDFEHGLPWADFNQDGFLDFWDYADFVEAFQVGC